MTALLAAALLASLAQEPAPVPLDLHRFMDRAEELDGRWVEFDAYVRLIGTQSGRPLLTAITGDPRPLRDGSTFMLCGDDPESHVAVRLRGASLGPLRRRDARSPGSYAGVRIRGVLRNRPYSWRTRGAGHEWVGSIDRARITRVTGGRCGLILPVTS